MIGISCQSVFNNAWHNVFSISGTLMVVMIHILANTAMVDIDNIG